MIGLVLVTHGTLALAMRDAMEHVVGKQQNLATVCIESDAAFEGQKAEIAKRIAEVDDGDGVIILTDMFGGTPSNLAMSLAAQPNIEVLGGVNLPMLIKLAKIRGQMTLLETVHTAEAAGKKYICTGHDLQPQAPNACNAAE
ncbi:PTS sugar transporter subunit IIA [Acidocella aminolytica]|jgi:PTS system mannose-specific IIA component|uniref:Phosphotransferase system permease nitrogen regulatory IIA protein n=1 Tax=Acidocella aminolytica 101 = DSM 11237 TaxID=1120923 RepID=A0A0D6PKZ4_9PROT|nr:PTS sugar transporter subunit IIA [Acidocella aminolytica]GAN81883.1 phosphotransferase system permease nitrogen regulatory IIA protein [Acidocella aminolytica 101 = DSM 11237]GBQ42569.1 PTS system transporter subunit IIA [Acidocella aminolytica 101 = DSM 11237]SHF20441.1 PTS system, mannose-specific IIA component [Acidocella aminolytica 101 = DSM 11237]